MSGAVAVHSAYNGSGTQGLAVTNTTSSGDDVISVFWNKHDTTKQLLHGSSLVEVVSSGAFGGAPSFGGSKIFNVNNDIDFMSDLYLHIDLGVTAGFTAYTAGDTLSLDKRRVLDFEFNYGYQFDIIERIDFMVGTQIWHTLSGHDIKVLTRSCCIPGNSDKMTKPITRQVFSAQGSAKAAITNDATGYASGFGTTANPKTIVNSVIWIPGLTATQAGQMRKFADVSENGYIQAAAPQQQVKIKVTFISGGVGIDRTASTIRASGMKSVYPVNTFDSTLIGATDSKNRLPVYVSNSLSSATTSGGNSPDRGELLWSGIGSPLATGVLDIAPFKNIVIGWEDISSNAYADPALLNMSVKLENVRLFAKQIMFTKDERLQIRNIPEGLPWKTKMTQSVYTSVTSGEETKTLDLDSFSLYASHLIISGRLLSTYVKEIELKLNSSSFSGTLPSILLKNHGAQSMSSYSGKSLGVNKHLGRSERATASAYDIPDLVFPLASTLYSGSSIPLNRFDSIRMIIKFFAPATSGYINVTCVGETTTLYKNGSATLAMY